jgi:hypothetical protein
MKQILIVLMLACLGFSQTLNWTGYGDTSNIANFRADSTKYSKAFPLSQWENLRLDVIFDDTTAAGRGSDSVKFYYFLEYGHLALTMANVVDTVWSQKDPLVVDTVDALTAANFTAVSRILQNDGTYTYPLKTIDTLSFAIGGGSLQSRNFPQDWDVFFRVGFKGVTGNNKDAMLKLRASVVRRQVNNVRSK